MNSNLFLNILLVVIISLLFLFLFSAYVPFHMDGLGHYHAIMCHYYPLNALNQFREACGQYDLAPVPGHYLPLRTFPYIGAFPSLVYYPLFRLWPSPYSARLLGLIMLAIQAFLICKLFRVEMALSFIILIFFMPYAFQHIVDFGTLIFQTTAVFFIYYLAQKWKKSFDDNGRHNFKYPFFIGVSLFLGIWTKLSFFALVPGIFVLIAYSFMCGRKILRKKLILGAIVLFFSVAVPALILFNSETRQHEKYYAVLQRDASYMALNPNNELIKYIFNPLLSADRIFIIGKGWITVEGFFWAAVIAGLLIFGIRQLYTRKEKYGFVIINVILFLLALFFVIVYPASWAMHHVILSFPFLILALFYIYSKLKENKFIYIFIAAFLIVNCSLYYRLAGLKPYSVAHPSILKISNLLNERYAAKYVFIVVDWGMYYIKALYGKKDQCVLYIGPFDKKEQVEAVKKILGKLQRKALFIGRINGETDLSFIKDNFPGLAELKTDFNTGKWRVLYEP